MCGIAGLLRLDGHPLPPAARDAVSAMMETMISRGPDGQGIWAEGPICLGHRRLSIIDIAGGNQPMSYANRRFWIVFNGEIYNFNELRPELEAKGAKFHTRADTEVIPAAYEIYGPDCLAHLEGMFAFALWDAQRQSLFCARDHFGKKPFYYTIQNGILAFASELTALEALRACHSLPPFGFKISPNALMRYLAYEYVPTPQSIYEEVNVLEPSSYLAFEAGESIMRRYWDLPVPEDKIDASEGELCAALREKLERAVALRMISDVPLGVFLSGGIDSSIVAGLMARNSDTPIQTFSIGFREASYDESRYARIVARAFHTNHHERILSAEECADQLPGIARRMDTPMADASSAPTWLLSALTREHVTVALGGDGADELWAGYEHYIGFNLAIWYNRLPLWLRKGFIEKLARLLPGSAGYINPRVAVETFLKGAAAPDWLRVETMLTAMGPAMQAEVLNQDWLAQAGKDFLEQDTLFEPTRRQYEHLPPLQSASPLARAFYVYCRQFLLDDILVKVDRCSMLHSLEVRSPFLDKHVAEFSARLPLNYRLHGFKRKYLLKKAFAELLPPEILHRNKRGFQIPVAAWLRGRLKPMLLDLSEPDFLKRQGVFNPEGIRRLMQLHFEEKADLRKPLWTFLILQLWLSVRESAF